jgi:hypothetical protein
LPEPSPQYTLHLALLPTLDHYWWGRHFLSPVHKVTAAEYSQ